MGLGLRRGWNRLVLCLDRRRGPGDVPFLEELYREELGRALDDESKERGLRSLRDGALTRRQLWQMVHDSPEAQAGRQVRALYQELLAREPSLDERWAGVQQLLAGGMDIAPLRQQLTATMEYYFRETPPPPDEPPYHVADLPEEVWLELTTRCNMAPPCIMCGRAAVDEQWHDMDPAIWQGLLPAIRQAREVGLHGGGEPLLYPHLFDLLGHIDPAVTRVGFNTNGLLLTEANSRRLIERQVAWISVSLDAASPEMYLRLRRRKDFDKVVEKVRRLAALRAEMGSTVPRIEINMTVMCANVSEAPHFVELAAEMGLDGVMFQQIKPGGRWALTAPDGYLFDYVREELSNCLPLHAEKMGQAWERAGQLGLAMAYEIVYRGSECQPPDGSTVEPLGIAPGADRTPVRQRTKPAGAPCADPWDTLLIYVDGQATFCCYHFPTVILGNVCHEPLEAVWNGPRARAVRDLLLREPEGPRCCQGCCLFP